MTIPPGDAKVGKGIFDDQCSVCHGIEVHALRVRVTARELLLLPWAESSEEKLEKPLSVIARP